MEQKEADQPETAEESAEPDTSEKEKVSDQTSGTGNEKETADVIEEQPAETEQTGTAEEQPAEGKKEAETESTDDKDWCWCGSSGSCCMDRILSSSVNSECRRSGSDR